jgi:predicted PurR-regulated permease PerM
MPHRALRADWVTVFDVTRSDPLPLFPTGEPPTRRERLRAAVYIATVSVLITLVILAVVFDRFAAVGVLLIVFLSFIFTYLIAPGVERLRRMTATRRGRPVSRSVAVLAIYGAMGAIVLPIWSIAGHRVEAAADRATAMVPQHTARFIEQLRAGERWAEPIGMPDGVRVSVNELTRRVSQGMQAEVRQLGAELTGIRRLVPWLSIIPVIAFLLLTRWSRFRRSTTRVLPTPHLQWRGDEFLRHVNSLLAAYTRAQVTSGLIVAVLCWIGFAVLRLPYPGTLGFVAGVLEIVPLAGPIVMAVIATAMAPDRALPVLAFLAGLRVLQDYAIYPRLISQAMDLHPIAVVVALWVGAAVGGLIGVCLAIPVVGVVQVAWRHWREYREIENLVEDSIRRNAAS